MRAERKLAMASSTLVQAVFCVRMAPTITLKWRLGRPPVLGAEGCGEVVIVLADGRQSLSLGSPIYVGRSPAGYFPQRVTRSPAF